MVLEAAGETNKLNQGYPMNIEQRGDATVDGLTTPKKLDDCLEIVVSWIERNFGKSYFVRPLDSFQAKFGKVNPEDDFYQSRMNYFLEYCVLEFPMDTRPASKAPVSKFFEVHKNLTSGDDAASAIWRDFCGFRHSLFQVLRSGHDVIFVRDLVANKTIKIQSKAGETLKYLGKKSIFQGFIFGHHDLYSLGQGLIMHPNLANAAILRYMRQHCRVPRFTSGEIARSMAQTNMRYLRMQHVNPAVIYHSISG